jgi:hypothetical protein
LQILAGMTARLTAAAVAGDKAQICAWGHALASGLEAAAAALRRDLDEMGLATPTASRNSSGWGSIRREAGRRGLPLAPLRARLGHRIQPRSGASGAADASFRPPEKNRIPLGSFPPVFALTEGGRRRPPAWNATERPWRRGGERVAATVPGPSFRPEEVTHVDALQV